MFEQLSAKLSESLRNLRSRGRLSEADIDATLREIRRGLLDADVALEVVKDFVAKVRAQALQEDVSKALNPAQQVVQIVHQELVSVLGGEQRKPSRIELVNSIINPSHRIEPGFQRDLVANGKQSRMGDYNETLTLQELSDLVAFLESLRP